MRPQITVIPMQQVDAAAILNDVCAYKGLTILVPCLDRSSLQPSAWKEFKTNREPRPIAAIAFHRQAFILPPCLLHHRASYE
jgi:hypothetical protein